jgi:PAS domain S-box-containing protein
MRELSVERTSRAVVGSPARPWRVVVVDDSPEDRAEVRRCLIESRHRRYAIVEAETIAHGLDAIRRDPSSMPDCVILDFHLPDGDALDVLASLRDDAGAAVCPIVVLTGADDHALGAVVLRAGAQDFVGKSWMTSASLTRALDNAVERHEMAGELRERERQIRLKELELRTIADNVPDILARFDRAFRHVFVNKAAQKATGISPEDFVGKTNRELGMPAVHCERLEAAIASVFSDGERRTVAFEYPCPDGARHYVGEVVPERDVGGAILTVLNVTRDVTDQKALERELAAEAARFRALTLASAQVVWTSSPEGVAADSPTWRAFTGQTHEAWTEKGWLDAAHPEDRARVRSEWDEAVRAGRTYACEYRVRRADGTYAWTAARGVAVRDDNGAILEWIGTTTDITESKERADVEARLQDQLAEERRRLALLLDEMPFGVTVRDVTANRVVLANKMSKAILQVDVMVDGEPSPLDTGRHRHLDGTLVLDHERAAHEALLTGEAVPNRTTLLQRGDGSEIVLRSSVTPIHDASGTAVLLVSAFKDITEEHTLHAQRERAAHFAEQFVGILGHDLRNPLNSVAMGAQLLRRRTAPEHAEAIDRMLASTQRMARMVDQLLDLTRSRIGGGIGLDRMPVDLSRVVSDVVDELTLLHPDREVRSVLSPSATGTWDADRLAQVVSNLTGNALQHGARDRPVVVTVADDGPNVQLTVHNEGRTIPGDLLAVLFDPFRRGSDESKARSSGLGLGLYISREVVVAHGGDLRVESSDEAGTTFVVTLRRIPEPPRSVALGTRP